MKRLNIYALVLMLLFAVHPHCKKAPFFAGEGATLILSADRTVLTPGGDRTRLTVVGFSGDGEALHNHTKVVFNATLGSVDPPEVELMGGSGVVEFVSGDRSGVAEIKARSGNITAEPDPLQITIGSAALETLTISSNPSSFGPGGGRAQIRAYAFDAAGNLLPGIPLVLASSSGTFEKNLSVYPTDDQGMVEDFLQVTENAVVTVSSGEKTATVDIAVEAETENQPPHADFTYSPASPVRGQTIYFNSELSTDSDGSIVTRRWDFGDGNTASGKRVSHSFTWEGTDSRTFSVVLSVTDDKGAVAVSAKSVTVAVETENQPPTADFSYSPSAPKKDETIYFNAEPSTDSDGDIVSWEWDFGDGATGDGETVEHSYTWSDADNRTFTVTLTVTDDAGNEAVTSQSVTVTGEGANQPPTASFTYSPTSPNENETVYFNAESSTDSDGDIVSWEWDFGDGATDTGENVTHAYTWSESGDKTFTVTLKVTDDRGAVAFDQETVTVGKDNLPPHANFTYRPSSPLKDEVITFDAHSSSDSDGEIVSWQWDFGDGETGSGEAVNHPYTWTAAGDKSFVVILTVTDNSGAVDTVSKTVTVLE